MNRNLKFLSWYLQKHSNAAQALTDVIVLSREHMSDMQDRADPDPLLTTMEAWVQAAEWWAGFIRLSYFQCNDSWFSDIL